MADSSAPNWNVLVEEYAQGASDVEIAKLLKITLTKFYQLCEENTAFNEFAERGRTLSRAWWEGQARKNLWNKEFNTSLWNFNMKNRYGWADRVDTNDTTNKDPVNLDSAKANLQSMLKQLAKSNPELVSGIHLHSKETKSE